MAVPDLILALLHRAPAHGYDIKRDHDSWFPDGKPLAFGQVYAALARLAQQELVVVEGTGTNGGPERTVYALTERGEERLAAWFAEPAPAGGATADEIVRKTVAALRSGGDPGPFLARQRAAHLRRMRELTNATDEQDPAARLARDHLVAHLDADLRWLDLAVERVRTTPHLTAIPEEATR